MFLTLARSLARQCMGLMSVLYSVLIHKILKGFYYYTEEELFLSFQLRAAEYQTSSNTDLTWAAVTQGREYKVQPWGKIRYPS